LVATVVPWANTPTSARASPRSVTSSASPVSTARAGVSGVEAVLWTLIAPSTMVTTSVNVPPISTPMRGLVVMTAYRRQVAGAVQSDGSRTQD